MGIEKISPAALLKAEVKWMICFYAEQINYSKYPDIAKYNLEIITTFNKSSKASHLYNRHDLTKEEVNKRAAEILTELGYEDMGMIHAYRS